MWAMGGTQPAPNATTNRRVPPMSLEKKSTRNIKIDGMSSQADVTKVTGALKVVSGLSNQTVKVGSATIQADKAGTDAACKAISGAGFKAHEVATTK